jgi:Zn-dependent protease
MALVAVAGPTANLLMAVFWALIIRLALALNVDDISRFLVYMGQIGVGINVMLMLVNLLPIPPLDGGRVAVGLLPYDLAVRYSRIEPYGFYILLGLMFTGLLSAVVGFPMQVIERLLFGLAGI